MKVTFTETEYKILARAAERMIRARRAFTSNEWNKPANKAIKAFSKKFGNVAHFDGNGHEVHLDRNLLRLIQDVCRMQQEALEHSVIPEYVARGLQGLRTAEYHAKAVRLAADCAAMVAKVEALL